MMWFIEMRVNYSNKGWKDQSWKRRWENLLEDLQSQTIEGLPRVGFLGEHWAEVGDGGDTNSEKLLHVEQGCLLGLDLLREHLAPLVGLLGGATTGLLACRHHWEFSFGYLTLTFFLLENWRLKSFDVDFVLTFFLQSWLLSWECVGPRVRQREISNSECCTVLYK